MDSIFTDDRINHTTQQIPLVIPAFRPDEKLLTYLQSLKAHQMEEVILVDDGSGKDYEDIFRMAQEEYGCHLIRLYTNMGKGYALRIGFNEVLHLYPDAVGCVTTDCNGSFDPEDVIAVMKELAAHPKDLVLGKRILQKEDFTKGGWIGTRVLQISYHFLDGIIVSDPQSGLHGIPLAYMEKLMHIGGNGYEFDTKILTNCKKESVHVREVQCKTRYARRFNGSGSRTVRDNLPIYLSFLAYISTSLLATIIDLFLFAFFCPLFERYQTLVDLHLYIIFATAAARAVSSTVNYYLNYRLVFQNKSLGPDSFSKWIVLVVIQGAMSAAAVSLLSAALGISELAIKVPVDFALFFFSYYACRKFVYTSSAEKK